MTVSEQIIQVINALCAKFGIVIDWTNENVIPYITTLCTKLVCYGIWTSVAWIVIMTVVDIVWFILMRANRSVIKESYEDADLIGFLAVVGSVVLIIATIAVIGTQIFDIIKCVTFPEMFVIEYIRGIIETY